MSLIETVNLCQMHGEHDILKKINLKVDKGEVFTLIGPTGAGKTTLLRLIDLLEAPTSGRLYFDGIDVTESRKLRFEVRRRMTFVFQKPVVFNMSVYDNIAYGLKWRRKKRHDIREKVNSILETVSLMPYKNRNARTLSGGEAQRVAIARAIVIEPEVLLLDEPTANLDPTSISKIEELISHIAHHYGTTIIMATHDMPQGQRLAGRIGVLQNGEMLQVGAPNEIFCSPNSKEVAEFIGIENILGGIVIERDDNLATIAMNNSTIQAISDYAIGDRVYVLIRPEDITFTLAKDSSSARNIFKGKITGTTPVGQLVRIKVDCGFPLLGVVTKRSAEELNLTIDEEVYASFKATAIHTIKRWN